MPDISRGGCRRLPGSSPDRRALDLQNRPGACPASISRDESVKLVTTLAEPQEQIDQRAQHVTAVVAAGEHA